MKNKELNAVQKEYLEFLNGFPGSLEIEKQNREKQRLMSFLFYLHIYDLNTDLFTALFEAKRTNIFGHEFSDILSLFKYQLENWGGKPKQ